MSHLIADWSSRDFFELTELFSQRCAQALPGFLVTVAKWRPEDLIPGLSDIDTRLICQDLSPEEWIELDEIVGRIHLELVLERPEWSRKLEHTPGVCLTASEALDEALYQPEMHHWSYYYGDQKLYFQIRDYLRNKPWCDRDEYYHLKRWLMFWGPYNREIDPPINIAPPIERKYLLHSRAMHYFIPSLQAALSLIKRRAVHGKKETLYRWMEIYPHERVLEEVAEMLDKHYEVKALEDEEEMYAFEERCFVFLRKIAPQVLDAVTIVELEGEKTMESLKAKLAQHPTDPLMTIYNGLRFSRIRRGRYLFYLNAPDYFATDWLIWNEMRWLSNVFTASIFEAYARLRWGKKGASVNEVVALLTPHFLSVEEGKIVKELFKMTLTRPDYRQARRFMRRAVEIFKDYYLILEKIFADAKRLAAS